MEFYVVIVVGLLIGFISGYLLAKGSQNEIEYIGNLRIDRSADEPYMFLELQNESDFDQISKMDKVTFKVIDENYKKTRK